MSLDKVLCIYGPLFDCLVNSLNAGYWSPEMHIYSCPVIGYEILRIVDQATRDGHLLNLTRSL